LEETYLNKNTKIALTALAIIIIVVALGASLYYLEGGIVPPQTNSQVPAGNPPSGQLKISGEVEAEKNLTISDLTQMPLVNVTNTIKGETANYVGVTLTELLNRASALWDAGNINVVAGGDGYTKTVSTYQAYNSTQYSGQEYIVAFAKNGQWMDNTEGPLKLITPGLANAYNVMNVEEINLQPWTITINGSVSHPMTLTGSNITNYEVKTVNAPFAPGGEPQRTSDWTGTTLTSILQAAGVSSSAQNVTVTAIDGYSKTFTVQQVQSTGMLVGFKENGAYLKPVDGQPFRLFVPTEDFKWGNYWVRWVAQITVS
jgi:DMSO/TMAO reductase YedYZ molybdopterin-dependent catalytic subunit